MKLKLILAVVFTFPMMAVADSLTCELKAGRKSAVAVFDLKTTSEEYVTSGGVYDLSFSLNVGCQNSRCNASITIDSVKLEDEAGSTGFEFTRSVQASQVFSEPIENAPDRRKYALTCTYNP